jgi:hypothetical protein
MKRDDDEQAASEGSEADGVPLASLSAPLASLAQRRHLRRRKPRRRSGRWKWLIIALLFGFSLVITCLYAAALFGDITRHHWAAALDATRDAVPAFVGWVALSFVIFGGGAVAADRMLSADSFAIAEKRQRVTKDQDSARRAEQRVAKLTSELETLAADQFESGAARYADIDRQIAGTKARLDQATQWLTGARTALAVSNTELIEAEQKLEHDFPELAHRAEPTASGHA